MGRTNGRLTATLLIALLILGVLAWVGIGGLIALESRPRLAMPTVSTTVPTSREARESRPTGVALAPTAIPTHTQLLTQTSTQRPTIPPTLAPTQPATAELSTPSAPTPLPTVIPLLSGQSGLSRATYPTQMPTLSQMPGEILRETPGAAAKCPSPSGWVAYTVQPGDTLFGFQLGADNQVSVATLMQANCLTSNLLRIGQVIFLPAGVAEKSPKIDESAEVGSGGPRPARCPCQVVIRPGWRIGQIASAIDKLPAPFSGRDLLRVTAAGVSAPDYWFLRDRPAGASLEGFLFPGVYTIENGMSAEAFRDLALAAFAANVSADLGAQAAARGLTFWQVVNIASMIQRESFAPSEQAMIASVIYNRMAAGKGLGLSVTMQYAAGRPGNWWPPIGTVNIHADSPYNTNRRVGLPPTPISNPGLEAIRAAVFPAQTDYLYFSAKCGGGGNFYARTFEEFKQGLACK